MLGLHLGALVVLVHLGQVVAGAVQVRTDGVPPHWEVHLQHLSYVRAMGCWLGNDVVEGLTLPLPGLGLHAEEGGEDHGGWHPQEPSVDRSFNNWSHEGHGDEPAEGEMGEELAGELLELGPVELLELEDLIVCEIVVVNIDQHIPVLIGRDLCDASVFFIRISKPGESVKIQFFLHGHHHFCLVLPGLLSLLDNCTHLI